MSSRRAADLLAVGVVLVLGLAGCGRGAEEAEGPASAGEAGPAAAQRPQKVEESPFPPPPVAFSVLFRCSVPGSRLFLNGRDQGLIGDGELGLDLPPGAYAAEARIDGRTVARTGFEIEPDEPENREIVVSIDPIEPPAKRP